MTTEDPKANFPNLVNMPTKEPVATLIPDTLDAAVAAENRRYVATHVLAGLLGTNNYDHTNAVHVDRVVHVALLYTDALLAKLS